MTIKRIFKIKPDGTVDSEVKGTKGPECVEKMRAFDEALGGDIERVLKDEFYESAEVDDSVKVGE